MALNQLGLGFLFTARDEASHVIYKLERSLGRLNTAQKESMTGALVPGAIGAGAAWAGWKGLKGVFAISKEAGEFKQVLADVKVIAQATDAEMAKLHDASYASKFAAPKESAQALLDLAQAGYNAQDSVKLLQPSLDMMAASLGDLSASASANLAAQTMKAFGLEAAQADLVTDQLINTANDFALKARELPLLIGRASRGAISFGASLEETLVAVGLARNVMGGIEVAASGVSMAMERLIDPKHQKKLHQIGITATDNTGRFKDFSRILLEMQNSPLFQKKTFAQQEAFIMSVFGHRSLAAVQAFFKQVNSGVTTKSGEKLTGAAAVDYLLNNARNAAGAKQRFIDAHFGDNLPGQMKLLRTAMVKLETAVGETFEPMFARLAAKFRKGVDWLIGAWMKLGPGTQSAIGKAAIVILGLVTAFGALMAAKTTILILTAVLGALGTTFGGLVVSMAPVAAGLLLFAGLAYLVYQAYKTNFGGLGDFITGVWGKISLAVQGLVQAFTKGEFSGAVMNEIDKAENSGVKAFVITLYMWGVRIKNFFKGLGEGFSGMWAVARPIFKGFLAALSGLGDAFGVSVGKANDNVNAFSSFGEAGKSLGRVLGDVLVISVQVATWMIEKMIRVVNTARSVWAHFGLSAWAALDIVTGALQIFFGVMTNDGETFWRGFTNLAFGSVKAIVGAVYGMMASLGDASDWMTDKLTGGLVKTKWGDFFREARKNGINELNESQKFWLREAANAGNVIPGAGMSKMWDQQAYTPIKPDDSEKFDAHGDPLWLHKSAKDISSPSVAAVEAQKQSSGDAMKQLAEILQKSSFGNNPAQPGSPQQLNVNVDGQNLLKILLNAARADAAQSYQTPAAETP